MSVPKWLLVMGVVVYALSVAAAMFLVGQMVVFMRAVIAQ